MPIYALGDQVPTIAPDAYIHPEAVIIGSVTIGSKASIWPHAVLRGDDGAILIGARTSIQDGSVIHTTEEFPTTVGVGCVIGHLVHLEGCTIEDGALVGSNSVVLHQAVVGAGALVAASAVVLGGTNVPPGAMAMGIPAVIRPDRADPAEIAGNAQNYVERGQRFAKELRRID
jgi:carbonic anhydrase/acetyltransferase-like protein (isoleucine patch superfamily)